MARHTELTPPSCPGAPPRPRGSSAVGRCNLSTVCDIHAGGRSTAGAVELSCAEVSPARRSSAGKRPAIPSWRAAKSIQLYEERAVRWPATTDAETTRQRGLPVEQAGAQGCPTGTRRDHAHSGAPSESAGRQRTLWMREYCGDPDRSGCGLQWVPLDTCAGSAWRIRPVFTSLAQRARRRPIPAPPPSQPSEGTRTRRHWRVAGG